MSPDVNTLPYSPEQFERSRRTAMAPLPQPAAPIMSPNESISVPMRHPRPLTAAELYLECEKEQEAVVNRLTRELTSLRAQTSSVASNASASSGTSTSLLPIDISDPNPTHQLTGPTHPTPSRERSNSSISTRSIPTPLSSSHPQSTAGAHPHQASQASIDRATAVSGNLSRQPSISASGTSTPPRQSIDVPRYAALQQQSGSAGTYPHRPPLSREASQGASSTVAHVGTPVAATHRTPSSSSSMAAGPGPNVQVAMQHLSEATAYRSEMEIVKAENEALRQRVLALERALRARRRNSSHSELDGPVAAAPLRADGQNRQSRDAMSPLASSLSASGAGIAAWAAGSGVGAVAGPRERSESQSTTASSRRGLPLEDEVRFGESAAGLSNARS